MFTLNDLEKLYSQNPNVQFKKEQVGGSLFTTVNYMLADRDLFKSEYGLELRGVCFDQCGKIASRPFHKFFNLNENEETQKSIVKSKLWCNDKSYAMLKIDGSMVTPVLLRDDKVVFKTKKSFYSDVAIKANAYVPDSVKKLSFNLLSCGMTPIFEFTHPEHKIVINYGSEPKFTLLAIRSNYSGAYVDIDLLKSVADEYNIAVAETFRWEDVIDDSSSEGIEGYVLVSGTDRFKVKTKWYLDRHHMLDVRERDIAEMYLNEVLDDMIPEMLQAEVDMERVEEIKREILADIEDTVLTVNEISDTIFKVVGKDPKDIASWFSKNGNIYYSSAVFKLARGNFDVFNWAKEQYKKNKLKSWSLISISNSNFGVKS